MGEYFKEKYKVHTNRLQDWDYSAPGYYYVTICTKDRFCCFGEIKDGEVRLSKIGKIVFEEWLMTPKLRSNVFLDDFIIMPNHIHGIIVIKNNNGDVETQSSASLRERNKNTFGPQIRNLGSIIRGFKAASKNRINTKFNDNFHWQPRFYEHIIRDQDDLARIKEYIAHNPINWENDKNNPINIKK